MGDSEQQAADQAQEFAAYAAWLAADLAPPEEVDEAPPAPARPPQAPGWLARLARRLWVRDDPGPLTPRRILRAMSKPTRRRALARLRNWPAFRADEYVKTYPDIARERVDPCRHALFVGGCEERRLFRPETLARCLGAPLPEPARLAEAEAAFPISIHVSSLGNLFMREIADDLAAALGDTATVLDETAPIGQRDGASLIVAPHEFFTLGRGRAWMRDDVIANAVMLNTEQPQTRWFARGLPFLLAARGMMDLSPQTAAMFAANGMPSLHLVPAPQVARLTASDRLHPLFRVLPPAARGVPSAGTPFAARPLDLCFFGSESRHREHWLTRFAPKLAGFDSVIHYRREERGPIRPGTPDGTLTRLAQHVGGHAKIVLNLHRDVFGTLEWHRVVRQGMATGAVVVSEICLPHPLLMPGVHFFEAPARQIPELVEWLVRSEDGRRAAAQVQAAARRLLTEVVTPRATAATLRNFLWACRA